MPVSGPLPKYQSGPIQCSPLLKRTLQRREFITLLGGLRPGRHIAHISVQKQRINGDALERAHRCLYDQTAETIGGFNAKVFANSGYAHRGYTARVRSSRGLWLWRGTLVRPL